MTTSVKRRGQPETLMKATRRPTFGVKKFDPKAHLVFQKPMSGLQLEQQAKRNKRNRRTL